MSKKYLAMNGIDTKVAAAFESMGRGDFAKWCRKELRPLEHGEVTYDALKLAIKTKNIGKVNVVNTSPKLDDNAKKVKKTRKADLKKD